MPLRSQTTIIGPLTPISFAFAHDGITATAADRESLQQKPSATTPLPHPPAILCQSFLDGGEQVRLDQSGNRDGDVLRCRLTIAGAVLLGHFRLTPQRTQSLAP